MEHRGTKFHTETRWQCVTYDCNTRCLTGKMNLSFDPNFSKYSEVYFMKKKHYKNSFALKNVHIETQDFNWQVLCKYWETVQHGPSVCVGLISLEDTLVPLKHTSMNMTQEVMSLYSSDLTQYCYTHRVSLSPDNAPSFQSADVSATCWSYRLSF